MNIHEISDSIVSKTKANYLWIVLRSVCQERDGTRGVIGIEGSVSQRFGDAMRAKESDHPYLKANRISRLFYCWLNGILQKGSRTKLLLDDVYDVLPHDSSSFLYERLGKNWDRELKKTERGLKSSLVKALARTYGPYVLVWTSVFIVEEFVKILCPFLIGGLIKHFSQESESMFTSYMYALGICLCAIFPTIVHHPYFLAVFKSGMRMRISCCSLMFKKLVQLDLFSLDKTAVGQLINLMSNDVVRFDLAVGLLPYLFIGPLEVIIVLILLWFYIGWSGICGMMVLLLVIPFTGALAKLLAKLRAKTTELTDRRLSLMTEILNGIQLIKMSCWESLIEKAVIKFRMDEIRKLYMAGYCRGLNFAMGFYSGKLIILFTVLTYVLTGNVITAEVVFVTLSLYNHVRLTMTLGFPMALQFAAETSITIKRIQDFLLLKERQVPMIRSHNQSNCLKAKDLAITWAADKVPVLTNLNFDVRDNDLFVVVGSVGSGKTSLLLAILKELPILNGEMDISGSVAYVPQTPWIFNSSVKSNIIMGLNFNDEFYNQVIKFAALEKDLECLPNKDETIVGERGTTLSGGQRARVALARAMYLDAGIYLLDSPLSAVDANVGHFLFHKCINGFLAKKLRILVTHQLQYLPYANKILVIDKNQKHIFGSYQELISMGIDFIEMFRRSEIANSSEIAQKPDGDLQAEFESSKTMTKSLSHLGKDNLEGLRERLLSNSSNDLNRREAPNTSEISWSSQMLDGLTLDLSEQNNQPDDLKNTQQESMSGSKVSLKMHMMYLMAGGGMASCILSLLLNILAQSFYLITDWWLAHWCQSVETFMKNHKANASIHLCPLNSSCHNNASHSIPKTNNHTSEPIFPHTNFYLGIFALLSILVVVFGVIRAIQFFHMAISSSSNLHAQMLYAVMRSPATFFVDTPPGQILNRFSKDLGQIDDYLSLQMFDLIQSLFQVLGVFVVVSVANSWVILAIVPILVCFIVMRNYFLKTFRNIKRLEAISKSPVFSHVNSTFQGLHTIRCHGAEEHFIKEFNALQDVNTSAFSLFLFLGRWFAVRLEWLCTILVCVVAFASLLTHQFVSGPTIGLSLTYVLTLLWLFQWVVRQSVEVEGLMTSAERIIEYSKLPIEDVISSNIPQDWPSGGKIDFREVTLKYKTGALDALHRVTFTVFPGEKVGVVGRTGAGKSSIINVLLRLFDFDGVVAIDDIDLRTINLHHLRRNISIIPQDPTLFAGILRTNLDPLSKHSDPELWHVLKKVDMDETIREMEQGLYLTIHEGGKNLSVGQRQLLCMARALLENNKILIIDEATANVDRLTDKVIQMKLRAEFSDCTVVCIAHRLNTVMDYDKIMVLESGSIKEYGTPYELLQITGGELYRLSKKCGDKEFKDLFKAAKKAHIGDG